MRTYTLQELPKMPGQLAGTEILETVSQSQSVSITVGQLVDLVARSAVGREFSIYVFEAAPVVGRKVLAITPQYDLKAQVPALDWFGTASASSNGKLHVAIINNGVVMGDGADITVLNGQVSFSVLPHEVHNGDTLVITMLSGNIADLSLTLRYQGMAG